MENCFFVVVNRPGFELAINYEIKTYPKWQEKIILLKAEKEIDIASRFLREYYVSESQKEYLPPKVWEYIKEQGLYRR